MTHFHPYKQYWSSIWIGHLCPLFSVFLRLIGIKPQNTVIGIATHLCLSWAFAKVIIWIYYFKLSVDGFSRRFQKKKTFRKSCMDCCKSWSMDSSEIYPKFSWENLLKNFQSILKWSFRKSLTIFSWKFPQWLLNKNLLELPRKFCQKNFRKFARDYCRIQPGSILEFKPKFFQKISASISVKNHVWIFAHFSRYLYRNSFRDFFRGLSSNSLRKTSIGWWKFLQ